MNSSCTSCGVALPSGSGEYSRCPNCGAVQPSTAPPAPKAQGGPPGLPPRRPAAGGGPPAPPPRRPAGGPATPPSPQAAEADPFIAPAPEFAPPPLPREAHAANPFMAAEPKVDVAPAAANPFLAAQPAPTPAAPVSAPLGAGPLGSAPSPSAQQVAPLVGRPGAVAPSIKDPHAEFRRGGWQKPVLFGGLAALALGGMFYLVPSEEPPAAPTALEATKEPESVIGRTVAPEVIADPNNPVLGAAAAPEAAPQPTPEDEQARSPDRPDKSGAFADSFKAAAR